MSERETHSKLAVASAILPLGIWLYLALMYVVFYECASCMESVNRLLGDNYSALGIAFIAFIILFGVIPIGGHLAGLIFGIIGLLCKNKKRVFAVVGLILSALPLALLFVYRLVNSISF